jgi:hypothetical protein
LKLDLKPTSLTFAGESTSLHKKYAVTLEFYEEIDVENSKINHTSKDIALVLRKKEPKEEFWPRLLKGAQKVHFLKTDFDKVRRFLYPPFRRLVANQLRYDKEY